ncbi:uncharacterized protein LOC142655703 isoform X2 [Rhinoderma darwinii]|uniref:uncharacterized protein LOC142655703 isoform X2 n=1 Tax=Rhinoderma darwinii TaxID=43563 RepID=UPI003F66A113
MVHTLCYYGYRQHPSAEDWRQRAWSMDSKVPSNVIIPAVAARLKYYLDVQRKEAGFDLSVNQKDSNGKHRLYQMTVSPPDTSVLPAGRYIRHQPPRLKKNFLDNKLEASLRSHTWRPGWNKKAQINPDHKQQVQGRIREKMSAFTVPERFARNHVFLRGINWKGSDWKVHSLGNGRSSPQNVSHGEFKRLISSAANLIVATTSDNHLQDLHQRRSGRPSLTSSCVNVPTSCEEPSPKTERPSLDEDRHTYCDQSLDLGLLENQTVPATSENIDYEVAVHTTAKFPEESTPSMILQLYGESGRTNTLSLQNPLNNSGTSSTGQAFIFHVKTRDVGELTDLCIGINKKDKACIWYCKKIIVRKGRKEYIFPYNNWLSPCMTIKAQVMRHVSAATRTQTAADKDSKNCQMKKYISRPLMTKPQQSKITSCLVTSKKVEYPHTQDGKVQNVKKENKNLDRYKINNNMSTQSPRTAEGNASLKTRTLIRKYGSSERRPQSIPSSKKAIFLVSSGKTKTIREKADQVTSMVGKRSIIITSDGSKDQPLLGENHMDDVTSSNTSSDRDLTMQNNIQPPKYRRASSPASYVFFALENNESSIIVQVNGCPKRSTPEGSTGGMSRIKRVFSEGGNIGSQSSGENQKYINTGDEASELAILQELLLDSGNNINSGSTDSQPFYNEKNREETRADHHGADDDINKVQVDQADINDYEKLCSPLDGKDMKTSGYSCSCGKHSSYETDSTLDEEYIFSDTSLDLSLSEDDDSDSSSKSDVLCKGPKYGQEEYNADVMKISKHQIRRQRRVESCSENIFQCSVAAIHNQDDTTLRMMCQSHFFLPSITDEEGKTLLHHAAAQENPSICQVLFDTIIGLVNIDQQDKFGKTALHYAVQKGNPKTIKMLLDNGAKMEISDKKSKTVLDIALWKVQAK